MPELCEIVAPVPDALALELETVESLSSRTPAPRVYRHVNVSQKRKSEVSSSVAGANLRRKRRRVVAEHSEVEYSAMEDIAVNLDMEDIAQHFIGEVKRKEYFEYFDKPEKLTLKCNEPKTDRAGSYCVSFSERYSTRRKLFISQPP